MRSLPPQQEVTHTSPWNGWIPQTLMENWPSIKIDLIFVEEEEEEEDVEEEVERQRC